MRRRLALLIAVLASGVARADDPKPPAPAPGGSPAAPPPAPSPTSPTPESTADAVRAAVAANDASALKALAGRDAPDPWIVADELVRRGEFDAADAFAKAAPRADLAALPAYVAARRGKPDDPARRARLAAMNAALGAGRFDEALGVPGPREPDPIEDVVGVRLRMVLGVGHLKRGALGEASAASLVAGQAADRLGWLARADAAFDMAGGSAFQSGASKPALEAWERRVAVCERRGDRAGRAAALAGVGQAALELDDLAKALPALETALAEGADLSIWDGADRVRYRIGFAQSALGDAASARRTFERLLPAVEASGDAGWLADTVTELAGAELRTGSPAKAVAGLERALALRETIGDRGAVAWTLARLGGAQTAVGDLGKARSSLERAIGIYEALGDRSSLAQTLLPLGEVLTAIGALAPAAAANERALATFEALGDRAAVAVALLRVGRAQSRIGELAKAVATLERAATAFDALGDEGSVAATRGEIGRARLTAGEFAKAMPDLERALKSAEASGDRAAAARALSDLGLGHRELGEYADALACFERAVAAGEALGDEEIVSKTRDELAAVHYARGDYTLALAIWEPSATAHLARGDRAGAASTTSNVGAVYVALGEFSKALATYERALALHEAVGARPEAANTLGNIGIVQQAVGDLRQALATHEKARAAHEAIGSRSGAASELGAIGGVHEALGDYAKAISCYERAMAVREALGDKVGVVESLGRIASSRDSIGDYATALATLERVLAAQEAMGDRPGAASTLRGIGWVRRDLGDGEGARSTLERALAASQALGDRAGIAATLSLLGNVEEQLGNHATALATLEKARAAHEALGAKLGAARALADVGAAYEGLGDLAKALGAWEGALAAHEALGDRAGAAGALGGVGRVHERLGDHAKAIDFARRAVLESSAFARDLGAEEGAGARGRLAFIYDVGARAAAASKDAAALAFFLESGRAGALLEGLKARETLWAAAVPAELRAEEAKARVAEATAVKALNAATDAGGLPSIRVRRAELEAARARSAEVIARIQRDAKAGAALVYPQPATLDELRATLAEGDAMVLYALLDADAAALVLTRGGERIVPLGSTASIVEAASALALDDPGADPAEASARLASLVVKPLALAPATKRVLVSPAGALSYVPFAPLLPDVSVAYAPSGTTYRFLRGDAAERGEGVLALGDPVYDAKPDMPALALARGGLRLVRLPGTREEATALGTRVLLGEDASEAGLRSALGTKRWRAVHFACHGLVDPERPAFSSLALTPAGDDDGFLTALEVFRTRIPADLVVLSACETGKGRIVEGEGLVGLTRAFMFAGAPRVICSLWKVDDEATRALMTRFYELWNPKDGKPGLPTAAALKQAQEFVKAQEKWKHPYYWAAWVLWGVPD